MFEIVNWLANLLSLVPAPLAEVKSMFRINAREIRISAINGREYRSLPIIYSLFMCVNYAKI